MSECARFRNAGQSSVPEIAKALFVGVVVVTVVGYLGHGAPLLHSSDQPKREREKRDDRPAPTNPKEVSKETGKAYERFPAGEKRGGLNLGWGRSITAFHSLKNRRTHCFTAF